MKTSKLIKSLIAQVEALTLRVEKLSKQKSKNNGHKGHGITFELISDILRQEPEGLTVAELIEISSAAVGFNMSRGRIYACLRMHKRFYRSSSSPNVWYIDSKI